MANRLDRSRNVIIIITSGMFLLNFICKLNNHLLKLLTPQTSTATKRQHDPAKV